VRRPTTGVAHATVWGADDDADRLLDWLEVPRRHRHEPDPALDGLVLLDLPDHDSIRLEHRLEVDRLVELVDVLVWVLDPEKYADAAVHDRYLSPLAGHAGVLVVVLNQVDRLDAGAADACLRDLRALLDREGLAPSPLLPLSARTGSGVAELRALLRRRVGARRAAADRLTADVRSTAAALGAHCGDAAPGPLAGAERDALTAALAVAAGVPTVTAAVERSTVREGVARTGWPLVRWAGRLRPDPLRRLHLDDPRARTSLPPPGRAAQAAVATAVRHARDVAGAGLPRAWRDELRRTVAVSEERLADRLDQAVAGTELGPEHTPLWQRGLGAVQWLLLLTALAGAVWLLLLVVVGFFRLDDVVPLPRVQEVPVPTLLLVAGLLAGALLALLARPLVHWRARRRSRAAERQLRTAIGVVAEEELLAPMAEVRAEHDRFCAALATAAR
jgi:hypothetical protein